MDYRNPLIQSGLMLVDGIASKNAGGTHFATMLYQFLPWRDMRRTATVETSLVGLPAGSYNVTTYTIDRNHHNFFTKWLADTAAYPLVSGASRYNRDPSVLDIPGGPWIFWWNWRHDPVNMALNTKRLASSSEAIVTVTGADPIQVPVTLESNSVVLVECTRIP
jgi:beta-xylosidase